MSHCGSHFNPYIELLGSSAFGPVMPYANGLKTMKLLEGEKGVGLKEVYATFPAQWHYMVWWSPHKPVRSYMGLCAGWHASVHGFFELFVKRWELPKTTNGASPNLCYAIDCVVTNGCWISCLRGQCQRCTLAVSTLSPTAACLRSVLTFL